MVEKVEENIENIEKTSIKELNNGKKNIDNNIKENEDKKGLSRITTKSNISNNNKDEKNSPQKSQYLKNSSQSNNNISEIKDNDSKNDNQGKKNKYKKTYEKREINGYRNAMGEYIPKNNTLPLTNLAIPTPGPSDYPNKPRSTRPEYSILGKHSSKLYSIGPGPAFANIRSKEKYPYWTIGKKFTYPKGN